MLPDLPFEILAGERTYRITRKGFTELRAGQWRPVAITDLPSDWQDRPARASAPDSSDQARDRWTDLPTYRVANGRLIMIAMVGPHEWVGGRWVLNFDLLS